MDGGLPGGSPFLVGRRANVLQNETFGRQRSLPQDLRADDGTTSMNVTAPPSVHGVVAIRTLLLTPPVHLSHFKLSC